MDGFPFMNLLVSQRALLTLFNTCVCMTNHEGLAGRDSIEATPKKLWNRH